MPRISTRHYLQIHQRLAELWATSPNSFSSLSWRDQKYLHDYFVPTWQLITDTELLAHRQKVTAERPSLPQCAGRALRRLETGIAGRAPVVATAGRKGKPAVVVRGVARPEVDADLLAQALRIAATKLDRENRKAS